MKKTVLEFKNKKKETLRGILTHPDSNENGGRKDLVIFSHCGLMGAEGDYRSHFRIAEEMVKSGYHVFRFSPSGLGLSDGIIENCKTKDLFRKIQLGFFVSDIEAAFNFISSYDKYHSFTLIGVCGGGISSLLAAASIEKINFVVPISCPVLLDGDNVTYDSRFTKKTAMIFLSAYRDKIFSVKSWTRLILRKNKPSIVISALFGLLRKKIRVSNLNNDENFVFNHEFGKSVKKIILENRKILFIYGGLDRAYFEFEDIVLNYLYKNNSKLPFDVFAILDGNHMLSLVETQMKAAIKITQWLDMNLQR